MTISKLFHNIEVLYLIPNLHEAGMGSKTVSKSLVDNVTTVDAIIQKGKKYEIFISLPSSMREFASWAEDNHDKGGGSALQ